MFLVGIFILPKYLTLFFWRLIYLVPRKTLVITGKNHRCKRRGKLGKFKMAEPKQDAYTHIWPNMKLNAVNN